MADKKNAAEQLNEAVQLMEAGALSAEDFKKIKKEMLSHPVAKDSDRMGELKLWAEMQKNGIISADEFNARKTALVNAGSPPAPAPTKKKKRKVGCLTYAILVGGVIGVIALYNSLTDKQEKGQSNTGRSGAPVAQVVTQPKQERQMEGWEKAVHETEDWRSSAKNTGLNVQNQQVLDFGMSRLSVLNEWMKLQTERQIAQKENNYMGISSCKNKQRVLDLKAREIYEAVPDEMKPVYEAVVLQRAAQLLDAYKKGKIQSFDIQVEKENLTKMLKVAEKKAGIQQRVQNAASR